MITLSAMRSGLIRSGVGAIACAMLLGCETTPGTGDNSASDNRVGRRLAIEYGLTTRTWITPADAPVVALLREQNAMDVVSPESARRLAQNGFVFLKVPIEQIDAVREALGWTSLDQNTAHGQVVRWTELRARSVRDAGEGLAVDGRPRRFAGGAMRLMMRSWTVPMEDGGRVNLELQGRFDRRSADAPVDGFVGAFEGLRLNTLLDHGFAYILAGETPVDRTAPGGQGPGVGPGEDIAPPLSIGEYLFSEIGERGERGVLVFLPQAPDSTGLVPLASEPLDG